MKKIRKKEVLVIASVVAVVMLTVGVTFAYLMSKDAKVNEFNIENNEIKIEEAYSCPKHLVAGSRCEKEVKIENTGTSDAYVRVLLEFSTEEAKEQCKELEINSNWEKEGDYYYYKKALKEGEIAEPIIEYFEIKEDVNEADIKNFNIIVYAESVLTKTYSSAKEAFEEFSK